MQMGIFDGLTIGPKKGSIEINLDDIRRIEAALSSKIIPCRCAGGAFENCQAGTFSTELVGLIPWPTSALIQKRRPVIKIQPDVMCEYRTLTVRSKRS